MFRILVFGGSGQLGSEIVKVFDAIAPSHKDLDVKDFDATHEYIRQIAPNVVINCTAYHDVGGCENNPQLAHLMNCEVPKSMASACNDVGATFVHFSTDYVFDGKKGSPYYEDDQVAPLNEYGRSKVCGEQAIMNTTDNYIIGRVSSLYGGNGISNKGPCFVEKVLNATDTLRIVDDQLMSPTYAGHVAIGLKHLLNNRVSGIIHMNNAGCCSWYEFACKIKEMAGLIIDIEPIRFESLSMSYKTPINSSMGSNTFYSPHWISGLAHYLYSRGRIVYE